MKNIYLTDSDEEAIVDFVKDHEELYYKIDEHFKDKERRVSLGEFHKQSQAVCHGVQDLV